MTFMAPPEGCAPRYGNCQCACHSCPGLMHMMACCRPSDGLLDATELTLGGVPWKFVELPTAPMLGQFFIIEAPAQADLDRTDEMIRLWTRSHGVAPQGVTPETAVDDQEWTCPDVPFSQVRNVNPAYIKDIAGWANPGTIPTLGQALSEVLQPLIAWQQAAFQTDARKRFAASMRREQDAREGVFAVSTYPGALLWGEQEWRRMGQDYECELCGRTIQNHPIENGPGYGNCSDEFLVLHRLCDGRLGKL